MSPGRLSSHSRVSSEGTARHPAELAAEQAKGSVISGREIISQSVDRDLDLRNGPSFSKGEK